MDAQAAGIGTIVTPQGYHLDMGCEITHRVETKEDILRVLKQIEKERKKHFDFVNKWTWENYTLKHLEIWKYMLHAEDLSVLLKNRGEYLDGIFSLLLDDLVEYKSLKETLQERRQARKENK